MLCNAVQGLLEVKFLCWTSSRRVHISRSVAIVKPSRAKRRCSNKFLTVPSHVVACSATTGIRLRGWQRYSTSRTGPLALYKAKVSNNTLKYDAAQEATAVELEKLYKRVAAIDVPCAKSLPAGYQVAGVGSKRPDVPTKSSATISLEHSYGTESISTPVSKSFWSQIFKPDPTASPKAASSGADEGVKGLWLYGEVGSGKTMLMELFYDSLSTLKRKRRVHFDSFMLEVYRDLWKWQNSKDVGKTHAMESVARRIFDEAYVLCFDEFQVADIASSQVLYQLFDMLFRLGAVCVITSNRVPDDLHKGGGQKESFAPFVTLLKTHCKVWTIQAREDYRALAKAEGSLKGPDAVYYLKADCANYQARLRRLYESHSRRKEPLTVQLYGRDLGISFASVESNLVAEFAFDQLFSDAAALGPADYLLICERFEHVAIDGIPVITLAQKNEARRFISFVDAAYENKTKLILCAEATPESLFANSSDAVQSQQNVDFGGDTGVQSITGGSSISASLPPLFTGEEEIFAFKRTVSRLYEMQSVKYALLTHRPQRTQQFLERVQIRSQNFTHIRPRE